MRDAPECFGLDNFLYNYNKIAKYGLNKTEIKDLQSHKSEEMAYSRLTKYSLAICSQVSLNVLRFLYAVTVFFNCSSDNLPEYLRTENRASAILSPHCPELLEWPPTPR